MIDFERRKRIITELGTAITVSLKQIDNPDSEIKTIIRKAGVENPWFTEGSIIKAFSQWSETLTANEVENWLNSYPDSVKKPSDQKNVAVINAGNIPLVGLHDMLTVIASGHRYIGKNATGDSILLPYIASIIYSIEPSLKDELKFVPKLEKMDAVIATGSNNSARYFEFYFGKYPHIIRKNMNGVAVLSGNESTTELTALGDDIFSYFGLGCRNVSKLYVPNGYDFKTFFESIYGYNYVMMHNKYMNNFDYNNSVLLLKLIPFLQNGFLIVRKEKTIASAISVLHFEEYDDKIVLEKDLLENEQYIQCIATDSGLIKNESLQKLIVPLGKTQSPKLTDYADRVDTLKFLTTL